MQLVNHSGWDTACLREVAKYVDRWLAMQPRHSGWSGTSKGRVVHVVPERSPLLKKLPARNTHRRTGAVTVTVPRGLDKHLKPLLETGYLARSLCWVLAELSPTLGSQSELRAQLSSVKILPKVPKTRDPQAATKKRELALGNAIKRRELWARRVRLAQRRLAKWQKLEKRAAKQLVATYAENRAEGVSVPQPKVDHAEFVAEGRLTTSAAFQAHQTREEAAARVAQRRRVVVDQLILAREERGT